MYLLRFKTNLVFQHLKTQLGFNCLVNVLYILNNSLENNSNKKVFSCVFIPNLKKKKKMKKPTTDRKPFELEKTNVDMATSLSCNVDLFFHKGCVGCLTHMSLPRPIGCPNS